MSEGEHQYLLPEPEKEVARLTEQDAIIVYMMGNKRILAPVDLKKPGLQILDSATADALFLREIQPLLTAPYKLLGFDIMPSFFPPTPPPHTTLAIHDIAEPWPAELLATCDLVHQRLAIPGGAKKATPRQIVGYLCQLVKPGGWIQLGEMDVSGPVHGGPAMRDVWTSLRAWMTAAGAGATFAHEMAGWLREEGFDNVTEEHVEIDIGPRCKDAEWGARSRQVMLNAATGVAGACKSELYFTPPRLSDLPSIRKFKRLTNVFLSDERRYPGKCTGRLAGARRGRVHQGGRHLQTDCRFCPETEQMSSGGFWRTSQFWSGWINLRPVPLGTFLRGLRLGSSTCVVYYAFQD